MFSSGARIVTEQIDLTEWRVVEGFYFLWFGCQIPVPAGFKTDFASVPRMFVWFLPRTGAWTMAAVVHDVLWRDLAPAGRFTWRQADRIFRDAMYTLEVPFMRRWVMWSAVRLAAIGKGQWRDWLATAPAALAWVALIAAVMSTPALAALYGPAWMAVAGSPPVGILVVLLVWTVLEWLVWAFAEVQWRLTGKHTPPVEPGVDLQTVRRGGSR